MSEYPSEMPEEPTGVGSIIRVVFKDPVDSDTEVFYVDGSISRVRVEGPVYRDEAVLYVGVAPGLWVVYGGDGVDKFTWEEMFGVIQYGEAEEVEVVYEGFGAAERNDASGHHVKDWIWMEAR